MQHGGVFVCFLFLFFGQTFWRDTVPASHPSCVRSSAAVQRHYHLRAGGTGAEDYPCNSQILLDSGPLFQSPHHSLLSLAFIASRSFSRSAAFHSTHTHTHSMCRRCFLATTSPCGVYVQLCIMLVKKRIAATMKTIEYLHLLVF